MQTFLPFADFRKSAAALDNARLGKQRVECLQILRALSTGPYQVRGGSVFEWKPATKAQFDACWDPRHLRRRTPWFSHPAAKMWQGHGCALFDYSLTIIAEWKARGFKDTCEQSIRNIYQGACDSLLFQNKDNPAWLGNADFHRAHQSNLIRKNPAHYGVQFPGVPDDLPYVWPNP